MFETIDWANKREYENVIIFSSTLIRSSFKNILLPVKTSVKPLGVADTQSRASVLRNNASAVGQSQIINPSTVDQ